MASYLKVLQGEHQHCVLPGMGFHTVRCIPQLPTNALPRARSRRIQPVLGQSTLLSPAPVLSFQNTWGGSGFDRAEGVALAPDGSTFLAATAKTAPPYVFNRAPTNTSRPRGTVATPAGTLANVTGTIVMNSGVAGIPPGSESHAGASDAALVRVLPKSLSQ